MTDRQTDRPRYSVNNNRPIIHSTAMQPNNNIYSAVVVTTAIARVHPVHLINTDLTPGVPQPSDQAIQFEL